MKLSRKITQTLQVLATLALALMFLIGCANLGGPGAVSTEVLTAATTTVSTEVTTTTSPDGSTEVSSVVSTATSPEGPTEAPSKDAEAITAVVKDALSTEQTDAVSGASTAARQWEVQVSGPFERPLTEALYWEVMARTPEHTYAVERKGVQRQYRGIALSALLKALDNRFDETFWNSGHDIILSAADGYSATFSTAEIPADALVVYDSIDGESAAPGTIGIGIPSQYAVKDLASIEIIIPRDAQLPAFRFVAAINGSEIGFTFAELKETPYIASGTGGYTTSAGTYYESRYTGIRIAPFIQSFLGGFDEGTVTARASDGYAMSYAMEDLLDSAGGTWILAFEMDGALLAEGTGPMRVVRILEDGVQGPVPNIDGHNSAKLVTRLEVSGEVYRDFSLTIQGHMTSVLDRTTIQSGIACSAHQTSVDYLNKKTGETEHYTGIPLFALLAYGDDALHAPHKSTDKAVLAYDKQAASQGYQVRIVASDGYAITLDSRQLDGNSDVIVAMYRDGAELAEGDWPLKLVWDAQATLVPEGIKAVKQVARIELVFDGTKGD